MTVYERGVSRRHSHLTVSYNVVGGTWTIMRCVPTGNAAYDEEPVERDFPSRRAALVRAKQLGVKVGLRVLA